MSRALSIVLSALLILSVATAGTVVVASGSAASAIASASAGGATAGVAAATITVDDGGGADYTSIQAAVDDAATGDTIEVRPGTYREEVTVDRTLTIVAPDGATLNGSTLGNAPVGITIEGGAAPGIVGVTVVDYERGVDARSSTGDWTLRNIHVRNASFGAVHASETTGNWTIENSTLEDELNDAVDAGDSVGDWTIRDSTLTSRVYANNASGRWTVADVRLTDSFGEGIVARETDSAWTIRNTTVRSTDLDGISAGSATGAWTIDNVTVRDTGQNGISARSTRGDWTIRGTVVRNNSDDGISAYRASGDWTVLNGTIRNNSGTGIDAWNTNGSWEIHESAIVGNGVGVEAAGSPDGDATRNWWGACDGPSGDFSGSGDVADGTLTVEPFYTDAARTTLSNGTSSPCAVFDFGVELQQEATITQGGDANISAFVSNNADRPISGTTVALLVDADTDGQFADGEVVASRTIDFAAGETRDVVLVDENVSLAAGQYAYVARISKDGQTTRSFTNGTLTVEADRTAGVVESRFGNDTEGWTVVGDAQGESAQPTYEATGGNPGGHLSATDDVVGDLWYWRAPEKFLGDKSGAYDRNLSYDLRASETDEDDANDARDVVLEGEEATLLYDHGGPSAHPDSDWTHYEIPLNASADGWIVQATGDPPTRAEFESVLSSLSVLRLRGEFNTGPDTGRLDNVVLEVGDDADGSGVNVTLQPADAAVAPGDSTQLDVVVEGIDAGVGSYEFTVNSSNTSTVTIASVSDRTGGSPQTSVASDGSGIRAAAFSGDTADTGPVTIATVTVNTTSTATGTAELPLTVASLSGETGTQYAVGSATGAGLTVSRQVCPAVVAGSPATDPDGDGLCEDVNGDGDERPGDATVLFKAIFDDNPAVTNNVDAFDFNADDDTTPADATVLFNEIF